LCHREQEEKEEGEKRGEREKRKVKKETPVSLGYPLSAVTVVNENSILKRFVNLIPLPVRIHVPSSSGNSQKKE